MSQSISCLSPVFADELGVALDLTRERLTGPKGTRNISQHAAEVFTVLMDELIFRDCARAVIAYGGLSGMFPTGVAGTPLRRAITELAVALRAVTGREFDISLDHFVLRAAWI